MSLSDRERVLVALAYGRGQSDLVGVLDKHTLAADTVRGDWLRAFIGQFFGLPRMAWTGEWREGGTYSKRVIGEEVLPTEDAAEVLAAFNEWAETQRLR